MIKKIIANNRRKTRYSYLVQKKEVKIMEVLSRKIFIDTGNSIPKLYMTPKQLCKFEGRSESFFRKIFTELSDQIRLGRYPQTAMGSDPKSVNYYVYRDYMTNRKMLLDRNLKKVVKPFNPAEVAAICPIVREVVTIAEEEK